MGRADFHRSTAPPCRAITITPDNNNDLPEIIRCFWVGTAGDLKVRFADDASDSAAVTLKNVAAGVWHPGQIAKIFATGTTAVNIIGCPE